MNPRLIYTGTGYLSVVAGLGAAACIYRPYLMMYGIALALLGFILSGINVFLNIKYFSEEEKFPKGYVGMFLSSLPVLFLMFMVFKSKH